MTNFERINKMNEQELAEFIESINDCCYCPYTKCNCGCERGEDSKEGCIRNLREWLKSEYVLTIRDIGVGEKFMSEDKTYVKILECERRGESVNAVEINSGHLAWFDDNKEIVK